MYSIVLFVILHHLARGTIDLPWTEADEAASEWCETEVPLQRIIQTLMAYDINSKSIGRLEARWFDRDDVEIMTHESITSGATPPSSSSRGPDIPPPETRYDRKIRSRAIFNARRLLEDGGDPAEIVDAHRSLRRAASPLRPLMALVPIISDMLDVRDAAEGGWNPDPANVSLPSKMRKYSNSICRLSDIEYGEEVAPYSCALADIFKSYFLCQKGTEMPTSELNQEKSCESSTIISRFPYSTLCYVPEKALQRQNEALSAAMFYWSDPDLHIPIMLHDFTANGSHVPKFIPTEIRQSEIFTYLTLYKSLRHLSALSSNAARTPKLLEACHNNKESFEDFIPGWKTVRIMDARSRDNVTRPLAVISINRKDECDIAIGFRGIQTRHGWFIGFDTRSAPSTGANVTHAGVLRLLSPTLAELQYFLAAHTQASDCSCDSTRIMLYGHSMGASLAQLISQNLANHECFKVEAVLYSPLRVLTSRSQRKHYTQTVNSRVLIDISDGLYQFPCFERNAVHGTVRCPSDIAADIQHLHGFLGSPGRDYYVENHGLILLDVDFTNMGLPRTSPKLLQSLSETFPFASAVLTSLIDPTFFEAIPSPELLNAAHFCSQACALSAACMGDIETGSFRWWCEDCPVAGMKIS